MPVSIRAGGYRHAGQVTERRSHHPEQGHIEPPGHQLTGESTGAVFHSRLTRPMVPASSSVTVPTSSPPAARASGGRECDSSADTMK